MHTHLQKNERIARVGSNCASREDRLSVNLLSSQALGYGCYAVLGGLPSRCSNAPPADWPHLQELAAGDGVRRDAHAAHAAGAREAAHPPGCPLALELLQAGSARMGCRSRNCGKT